MEDHLAALEDTMALLCVGRVAVGAVVDAACEALVAGHDSTALRELAGAHRRASYFDVEELLKQVAFDFRFPFHLRQSDSGRLAASKVLARACLDGELGPRELAGAMHSSVGHGHPNVDIELLVQYDDDYDLAGYSGRSIEALDRGVIKAATNLLA